MSSLAWTDVDFADTYEIQVLSPFGVYVHDGRVYLEGGFLRIGGPTDYMLVGTIPTAYAPDTTVTVPVITERQNSDGNGPFEPTYLLEVHPDGQLRWPVGGAPLRMDVLDYSAIVHTSWVYSSETDTFTLGTIGTGLAGVEHGNRLHLGDTAQFTGATHSSLLGDDLPTDALPVPYGGTGSSWRRVLAVPFPAPIIRPVQTYVYATGGSPGGGFMQTDEPYLNAVSHLTIDAVDLGNVTTDHGGWGPLGFFTSDVLHAADEGWTDVGPSRDFIQITHLINITSTAYATSTDDPTDTTVPGVMALCDSGSGTYYKLMLQSFGGNLVKALYRWDGGAFTLIGSYSAPIVTGFQNMRMDIFDVASYLSLPGAPADIDGYTDGVVFRVFQGASSTFYTAIHEPPASVVGTFANTRQGLSGPFTGPNFALMDNFAFVVRIGEGSAGVPLEKRFPADGASGALSGLGWHLADPPDQGVMAIDEPTRGIVPLGRL